MSVALPRVASRSVVVSVLAVGLWLGVAGRVQADPLNPLDFMSLGAFPTASGGYTINTSGTPTLTGPGGTTLLGVVSHGIAVFDFDSINVLGPGPGPPFQEFTATGSLPLALLSRTNATIAGTINGSGQGVSFTGPPSGGPGGGDGGLTGGGPGGGGSGVSFSPGLGEVVVTGGGGGGFGGPGGAGASSSALFGLGNVPGGPGGAPYGDLARQLQGGSGGGAASLGVGGGGGGAIEIGAVGSLAISGKVIADGGSPVGSPGEAGGSGGGILLHADSVRLTGSLSAVGGDGTPAGNFPFGRPIAIDAGGGGGGGRVTILSGPGGFSESGATIDVAGGVGGVGRIIGLPSGTFVTPNGSPGGVGVVTISTIPEPASLVLLGTGVLGLPGLGGMRRRAAPA